MSRSIAALVVALLAGCGGSSGIGGMPATGNPPIDDPDAIVAWGDSFTAGGLATSPDRSYPAVLAQLTGRAVYNLGVGGQTSDEIVARQGSVPALLSLVGGAIPDSGAVTVSHASVAPVNDQGPGPLAGTLAGVRGTLSFEQDGEDRQWLQFNRDGSGGKVAVASDTPFLPDPVGPSNLSILWIGNNNSFERDRVVADVHAAVQFLDTDRYVVLSLINGVGAERLTQTHEDIVAVNERLEAEFSGHFIDIREMLVAAYDPLSIQDQLDHLNDIVPTSLRADEHHPNDAGYALIAQWVAAFIDERGW